MKHLLLLSLILSITNMTAQDQGITSEVHRKYVNQIVFASSKSDLAFKSERTSAFKNEFSTSENIFGRIYLDRSLKNITQEYAAGNLMYDLYIDGRRIEHKKSFGMYKHRPEKTFYTERLENNDAWSKWTSWKVWLLPEESDEELKYGNCNIPARAFALSILDLSPGKHDVKMEVYHVSIQDNSKSEVVATGSFVLNVYEKDKKRLAFAYAPPLPKDEYIGSDKKEVLTDIRNAFVQQLGKEPILCGIYKSGWSEGSYALTGQKYKKISGWAVFEDTDGDGQVPITTFNFISDYTNGGWTKLRFDSHCLGCPDWQVETAAAKALAGG